MTDAALKPDTAAAPTQQIVVDEVFHHAPETIWRTLTSGDLIARWLMPATGFKPEVGNRFTFQTTPGGAWDGVIHCEVLEVIPHQRFSYAWKGGHPDNAGYGAPLDTVVTFTLTKVGVGTRLRLVHAGFVLPRNDSAFQTMGNGWKKVVPKLGDIAGEES
jgi:uncharacterized protein YndB with AHSA1/START domain